MATSAWSAEDNAAQERALKAADRYREKFGEPFGTWDAMGYPRELEAAPNEAIARGEPMTEEELYRRLGTEPPPPGALL